MLKKEWENYFQKTLTCREPHQTLLLAYNHFLHEHKVGGTAVDLGAGTGRDTLFLLEHGWNVLALDREQQSVDIILDRANKSYINNLEVKATSFSKMILPKEIDLINASYSLPFCEPIYFARCWRLIVDKLALHGRFAGHFFGEKQELSDDIPCTTHSYDDILSLFKKEFIIEYLLIENEKKMSADGKIRHWHVYNIVAKKTLIKKYNPIKSSS